MFDLTKKPAKCMYENCQLPKNNNRFGWQLVYIFVGIVVLFRSPVDFNFFQTFLFIAPIMMDIAYNGVSTKPLNIVRVCAGILNALVLIGCLFGMVGIIQDDGLVFKVSDSVIYFSSLSVDKSVIGGILAANLVVPAIYWIGAPCQSANQIVARLGQRRKEVEQV